MENPKYQENSETNFKKSGRCPVGPYYKKPFTCCVARPMRPWAFHEALHPKCPPWIPERCGSVQCIAGPPGCAAGPSNVLLVRPVCLGGLRNSYVSTLLLFDIFVPWLRGSVPDTIKMFTN